ncbi:MAG: circadian clock KaiB family protein [Chloroflexi bacterium]|nr:circadian clock KaiB family protein [Chloroflexota bacterium]
MTDFKSADQGAREPDERVAFRLYIAGGAPNSLRAQTNLRSLCAKYLPDRHQIEVVDVLADPHRALNDRILVTPTLVKVSPLPGWQMAGDLSATDTILNLLGLEDEKRNDERR